MGITGLIPFVKSASRPINIKEYAGCTVAVDTYCWLHKGAFSCADKLVRGEPTDQYVLYCLKFINMLLSYNIKPIMVFDGRHLPAKADTEKGRREKRKENKEKALELLRLDRGDEARVLFQRCVDVTHEMALQLIKRCRAMAVDCIVAPYEADSQLAYFNITGIAHIVITEDSDLLLFGCSKVLFKMDAYGNGLLVEKEKLPIAMKLHPDKFSIEKFRHMCILSGCDYLPSLPGIGLVKACKFIKRTAESNMLKALSKLGAHLNMPNLVVSPDYKEKFTAADAMFKHQPVFDPLTKRIVPLTPLPPGQHLPIDEELPPDICYQLALGNLEPFTLKKLDDWDPLQPQNHKTTSWNGVGCKSKSIWSDSYVVPRPLPAKPDPRAVERPTTQGKTVKQSVKNLTDRINRPPSPINARAENPPRSYDPEAEIERLRERFRESPPHKKQCLSQQSNEENVEPAEDDTVAVEEEEEEASLLQILDEIESGAVSPPKTPRNPFSAAHNLGKTTETAKPSGALAKLAKIRKTVVSDDRVVKSRFFASTRAGDDSTTTTTSPVPRGRENDDVESVLNAPTDDVAGKKTDAELRLTTETPSVYEFKLPDTPCGGLAKLDLISKLLKEQHSPTASATTTPPPPIKPTSNPFKKHSDKPCKLTDFTKSAPSPSSSTPSPSAREVVASQPLPPSTNTKYMLKSPKHVGLKRKKPATRPGPGQPSIFEMFAFQPKAKMSSKPSI